MIEANFYNFSKRENSTKQPSGAGAKVTMDYKTTVSMDNPTFLLETDPSNYNYVVIDGKYFFIKSKRYVRKNLFEIDCKKDSLATYKSSIKASTQYVLRTSVASNPKIFDNLYPLEVKPTVNIPYKTAGFDFSDPTYLVTVKGENGSCVYAMNRGFFEDMANSLYLANQGDIWQTIGGNIGYQYMQTFLDPFSYIVDVRVIPIKQTSISGTSTSSIKLGFWDYTDPDGVAGFKKVGETIYNSGTIHVTIDPGPTGNKEFLRSNQSRSIDVWLPGVGTQSFDAEKTAGETDVTVDYFIDKVGTIGYAVQLGNEVHFVSSNISMPIAIYSNVANVGGVVAGVTKVAGGAIAGAVGGAVGGPLGAVAGGVGGALTGAISGISSASPLMISKSLGVDGSWAGIAVQPNIIVSVTQYDIPAQSPSIFGYPYCQAMTLSSNGYYLIKDAQVDFGEDLTEKEEIKMYMENGFYIE